jgi:hypothetical protein
MVRNSGFDETYVRPAAFQAAVILDVDGGGGWIELKG